MVAEFGIKSSKKLILLFFAGGSWLKEEELEAVSGTDGV